MTVSARPSARRAAGIDKAGGAKPPDTGTGVTGTGVTGADARGTGGWRSQSELGGPASAAMFRWLTGWLPRRVAHGLIPPVVGYFLATHGRARQASARYLERVLPRPPRLGDHYRHFATFAAVIVDRIYLLRDRCDAFRVEIDGDEARAISERYRRRTDGFIVMGAHLGSFEVARAVARDLQMPPVRMVMFEENARRIAATLDAFEPGRSRSIIALGRPDSMLRVRDALADGAIIGMLPDRLLDDAPDAGDVRSLPFLGGTADFPIGPFRMAALLRAPVLLQLGLYEGGNRYRLVIEELADFSDGERHDRAARVEETLRRYVERLEFHARRSPFNWFNFYDIWRDESANVPGSPAERTRRGRGPAG